MSAGLAGSGVGARTAVPAACGIRTAAVQLQDGDRLEFGRQSLQALATPGHTAGHMSLWVELPKGPPVLLAGDAADLMENLQDEVAPGACWQDHYAEAVGSIRKLKQIAQSEKAVIWPNHDLAFYRGLNAFPAWHE